MSIKRKLLGTGIRVFKGNPASPLVEPALFLGITVRARGGFAEDIIASLSLIRPGADGYSVKELIADMELGPEPAMEKAIDIAVRGQIRLIYIHADIDKLVQSISRSA